MSNEDIRTLRNDYDDEELCQDTLPSNPFTLFSEWLDRALHSNLPEANGMVLATVGTDGLPSQRTVLMRSYEDDCLYFYSNYESRKAKELEHNSRVSCLFPWLELHKQVQFQGIAQKVDRENSAEYFSTRPRNSQIGAWASRQSEVLAGRNLLEERVRILEQRFTDQEVPLPDFWGGYRIIPERVEFWQGRSSRLHDRFVYIRERSESAHWKSMRLYP